MEIIREQATNQVFIVDNSKKQLETGRIGAEFVICVYTNNPIEITKELDKSMYYNLNQLLENNYIFDNNNLSYQEKNKIVWFSDCYCNIYDKNETDKINRLIIEKIEDKIKISYTNPYMKKKGFKKEQGVIGFSASGNGAYSRNIDTGLTFQDDVVLTFRKILLSEYEIPKTKRR